jgi:Family of unknown function (DUF6593)
MGPGNTITFHEGQKDGPVIATAEPCKDKQGSSKIQYGKPESTIALEHLPRRMLVLSPKTVFTFDDKKYYWKGYSDLFEEKTDKLVAQYTPKMTEGADPFTGSLLVTEGNRKQLDDLIVVSTAVMQQRSDARRRAVCHLDFTANVVGISCISWKAIVVLTTAYR